jgi:hypothetical protein
MAATDQGFTNALNFLEEAIEGLIKLSIQKV